MEYTDVFGFKKPEDTDGYDVADFNANVTKIDSLFSYAKRMYPIHGSSNINNNDFYNVAPPSGEVWVITHVWHNGTGAATVDVSSSKHTIISFTGGGCANLFLVITPSRFLSIQNTSGGDNVVYGYSGFKVKTATMELFPAVEGVTDPYGVNVIRPSGAGEIWLISWTSSTYWRFTDGTTPQGIIAINLCSGVVNSDITINYTLFLEPIYSTNYTGLKLRNAD